MVNIFRKVKSKSKLVLLVLALLLLGLLIPPLGKILLIAALAGLILYILTLTFPEIRAILTGHTRVDKVFRKYVEKDIVKTENILVEVGLGKVLSRLNGVWLQAILVEEELPEAVLKKFKELESTVVVYLRSNRSIIIVRDSDPETVADTVRAVISLLDLYRLRYRILNPEETINYLLSVFRM